MYDFDDFFSFKFRVVRDSTALQHPLQSSLHFSTTRHITSAPRTRTQEKTLSAWLKGDEILYNKDTESVVVKGLSWLVAV